MMNDSFLGLDKLEFLDISDVKANLYQVYYLCDRNSCGPNIDTGITTTESSDYMITATTNTKTNDGHVSFFAKLSSLHAKFLNILF